MHAHANGRGAVGRISDFGWTQVRSSFPAWSVPETREVDPLLYGDRPVTRLWMPQPYLGIDFRRAGEHLSAHRRDGDLVALWAT